MSKKSRATEYMFQLAMAVTSAFLVALCIINISAMQKTAKVITYTGTVRGGTQRLIKLEISGNSSRELENRLDRIISNLTTGEGEFDLEFIKDREYIQNLTLLNEKWTILKEEIEAVRGGKNSIELLRQSEYYFFVADNLALSAQEVSSRQATVLQSILVMLLVLIIFLSVFLVWKTSLSFDLSTDNAKLSGIAYTDKLTGIPNRAFCNQYVEAHTIAKGGKKQGVIMCDLNNLKQTNDSQGHLVGDSLIVHFADILFNCLVPGSTVGRWGGDEFIVFFENCGEEEVKTYIAAVTAEVEKFNSHSEEFKIDFAHGYALSTENGATEIAKLIEIADKNMYICKANSKIRMLEKSAKNPMESSAK